MKSTEKGFAFVEGILIFAIIALVAGTGYYVMNNNKQPNKSLDEVSKTAKTSVAAAKVTSFAECKKAASSIIQETFPEVCVTKDGEHFTDTTSSTQNYLVIKEWGIKIGLSSEIKDAYYDAGKKGDNYFNLRTHSLDVEPQCKNDDLSISAIFRQTPVEYAQAQAAQTDADYAPPGQPKIGNYYYYIRHAQYDCSANRTNDDLVISVEKAFSNAVVQAE